MLLEIASNPATPDAPRITEAEGLALARASVNLLQHWGLTDAKARDILGGLTARTYARWKAGQFGRIDRDLATRMSLLMGIHKALRYMFTDPARGYRWITAPNMLFEGKSPADLMAEGDIFALARLRAYLDAERGGW